MPQNKDIPKELRLLAKWQKILCLNDWKITLMYPCKPEEMEIKDSEGCVNYSEVIKAARIQIIDPKSIELSLRPFDFEETLVHELLHIKFCLLEDGEDWDRDLQLRVLHQILDEFARILVSLKRSKDGASN